MTIRQLLNEEIYGNTATVYHRCDENKLKLIIERTYQNQSHVHFANYDQALYTTYNMQSQMGQGKTQKYGDMHSYGNYVIKFAVKGVENFFFTNKQEYLKFHPNFKGIDFIRQQLIDAGAGAKALKDFDNLLDRNDHISIGNFLEHEGYIPSRFKGLQYNGKHDGDCLLIFDYTTVVPLSITKDDGKTWEKVQDFVKEHNINANNFKKEKLKNFRKNDLVKKEKQSRKIVPFHIQNNNLSIDYDIEDIVKFKSYKQQLQYKDFNNLTINSNVKRLYLEDMDFKKATINDTDLHFVFKRCNFDTLIFNKRDDAINSIDGEINVLEYKPIETIKSLYYLLDKNYDNLKIDDLIINAKCFNFNATDLNDLNDPNISKEAYATNDFSDLFRMVKLQKIIIEGNNLNKKIFGRCLRGTKIKAYYNSKILEDKDGELIERDDDTSLMMPEEKIFNY